MRGGIVWGFVLLFAAACSAETKARDGEACTTWHDCEGGQCADGRCYGSECDDASDCPDGWKCNPGAKKFYVGREPGRCLPGAE